MAEPAQKSQASPTSDDDQSPLAEMLESPPSAVARGAIYLITAVVAAGLAWGAFGQIDEVVTAPATVAPAGRVTVISAPMRGSLEQMLVDEGAVVAVGQRLMLLRSTEAAHLRGTIRRLEAALTRARADGETRKAARVGRLQQEIAEREATLAAFKDASAAKIARLRAGGPGSASEAEQAEREARLESARLESAIADARRRLASTQEEAELTLKSAERELEDARRALADALALAEVDPENEERVFVVARMPGIVGPIQLRSQSVAVERGQPLLALLPADAAMAVHIALPQADFMKVRPGQVVRVKLQSFPYQQFGGLTGKVREVSRVAVRAEQGPAAFSVLAILDSRHFTRAGRDITVPIGSAGMADIVVGRSSLLSRTLASFRDLAGE